MIDWLVYWLIEFNNSVRLYSQQSINDELNDWINNRIIRIYQLINSWLIDWRVPVDCPRSTRPRRRSPAAAPCIRNQSKRVTILGVHCLCCANFLNLFFATRAGELVSMGLRCDISLSLYLPPFPARSYNVTSPDKTERIPSVNLQTKPWSTPRIKSGF